MFDYIDGIPHNINYKRSLIVLCFTLNFKTKNKINEFNEIIV